MKTQVQDVMSRSPIVVGPETTVPEAVRLLKAHAIRRLPVLERGKLVGIVSDRDLKEAMPSPATSLSIWELTYLLGKLPVGKVMTSPVQTVRPDTPLREAAQLMLAHRIGGVPVLDAHNTVVGVVTVTDVLRQYVGLPELV